MFQEKVKVLDKNYLSKSYYSQCLPISFGNGLKVSPLFIFYPFTKSSIVDCGR